jgi:hypothetical protein
MLNIFLVGCSTIVKILRNGVQHQIEQKAIQPNIQPQYKLRYMPQRNVNNLKKNCEFYFKTLNNK